MYLLYAYKSTNTDAPCTQRERKQRLADKQMALDNAICDVNEERKRSERELESQRRRNADELQV